MNCNKIDIVRQICIRTSKCDINECPYNHDAKKAPYAYKVSSPSFEKTHRLYID